MVIISRFLSIRNALLSIEKMPGLRYNQINNPERTDPMEPIFYTVRTINGDYADLITDDGIAHSITMFLLPEGTTVGSRLKLENFQWELL